MDGITMGGGAGLSVHAAFRIATERTNFAFPETRIGFFPDVGASFFLPRLDGSLGRYLALTGESVHGVDAFYAGIATHYTHSSSLGALTARLAELRFADYASLAERLDVVDATIEEFATGLPHDRPMRLAGVLRRAIDRCFGHESVEAICAALEREAEHPYMGSDATKEWAQGTLETLRDRSPTSLKVALRALQLGQGWDIAQTFQYEHHIASAFMAHPDFVTGVTKRLVKRAEGRPAWKPATTKDVTDEQVDAFFPRPGAAQQLELLSDHQYTQYPYEYLGLPRDRRIQRVYQDLRDQTEEKEGDKVREKVVGFFLNDRNGKPGVREKVEDWFAREELARREEEWVEEQRRLRTEEEEAERRERDGDF